MFATGLNGFINAQGFPRVGMFTTVLGAVLNLILDPLFIFGLDMGVQGAALATVISQLVSAAWVLRFLTGSRAIHSIRLKNMPVDIRILREIISLGMAGFIMMGTNCLVQVVCNTTLRNVGGDLYVGVMTVLNSIREIIGLPIGGLTGGSQPVISYNYGAKAYSRVKQGIRFSAIVGTLYTVLAWAFVFVFPGQLISVFTEDAALITAGVPAIHIYFFGFFFMAFQFTGQSTFTALKDARHAIFFSLFRKAIIVVPLTLLLPRIGFGIMGVFLAEPISNAIGGLACFFTMWIKVYKKLPKEDNVCS
jgi:Na+-driven multidrug efflux pump